MGIETNIQTVGDLEEKKDIAGLESMKIDAEIGLDGDLVRKIEEAIMRINAAAQEVSTTSQNEINQITALGGNVGELNDLTKGKDEKIRDREKAFEGEIDAAKKLIPAETSGTETKTGNIEDDSIYKAEFEKAALEYLQTHDKEFFNKEYSGIGEDGYLIYKNGTKAGLPSQNLGGRLVGGMSFTKFTENVKNKFIDAHPDIEAKMKNMSLEQVMTERKDKARKEITKAIEDRINIRSMAGGEKLGGREEEELIQKYTGSGLLSLDEIQALQQSVEKNANGKIEEIVESMQSLGVEHSPEIKEATIFLDQENKIAQDLLNEQGFRTLTPEVRKFKSYSEHYGTDSKESSAYHLEERIKKFIELNAHQHEDEGQKHQKEKNLLMAVEYKELQDHPYYKEKYSSLSFEDFKKQELEILSKIRFFDATRTQELRIENEDTNKSEFIKKYLDDPQVSGKVSSGEIFLSQDIFSQTPFILEKLIENNKIAPLDIVNGIKQYTEKSEKNIKDSGVTSSSSESQRMQERIQDVIVALGKRMSAQFVKQIIEAGNFQNSLYTGVENGISRYNTGELYKSMGYQSNLKLAADLLTDPSQKQKFKEKFGKEPEELYRSELLNDFDEAKKYTDLKESPRFAQTFFASRTFSPGMDGYFDELFKLDIAPREEIMQALKKSLGALKFAEDRKFNSDVPDRNSKIREVIKLNQQGFITNEEKAELLNP